jgi:hypothetical protein
MPKFDYYRATFFQFDPNQIITHLLAFFDLSSVRQARGKHGYSRGAEVHRGDLVLARLWWGQNPGVCVSLSSENADVGVPALRALGHHQVSRADSCWDLDEPGLFDRLVPELLAFALTYDLQINQVGDWERGKGRTIYLGSRNSVVFLRIYEKGYEQGYGSKDHVRVECEVKPAKKDKKEELSRMTADQLWGVGWLKDFSRVFDLGLFEQYKLGNSRQITDFERAKFHLAKQYGPTLQRMIDEAKSSESFLSELNQLLREAGRKGLILESESST